MFLKTSSSPALRRQPDGVDAHGQLSRALDLPFLMAIPRAFIYVALLAWLATFAGLLFRLLDHAAALFPGTRHFPEK